ncbi:JAB1/MPN/MOV34 metalloenzyme domain [Dillenia turbinata]|uniref:JAB1/MPN/MOV34 metalloenzyme domain n=1 Tax=Dillenia turbinata TaxID=194707 RepID=A0AAN8VKG9_9MAGN
MERHGGEEAEELKKVPSFGNGPRAHHPRKLNCHRAGINLSKFAGQILQHGRSNSNKINEQKEQLRWDFSNSCPGHKACGATSSTATDGSRVHVHTVTRFSPSAVLSCTHKMPHASDISPFTVADSSSGSGNSKFLRDVHIPVRLMEDFLELARHNTEKDLETCGVLGAFLKNGVLHVTTLIVPKQESNCNSCQALNEEEIFGIESEHSLIPVGWIHTHPSQTCFMSSVDLHTQFPYQVMVPEAIAIVMAPTDATRSCGIFRLSEQGMGILRECQETGFHLHTEPDDGSPIYENCSNVYINPNLRFEIFDLR